MHPASNGLSVFYNFKCIFSILYPLYIVSANSIVGVIADGKRSIYKIPGSNIDPNMEFYNCTGLFTN